MIQVTIKSVGHKTFDLAEEFVGPVTRDLAQIVYDEAADGADKHTKTGALFQSLFNRKTKTGRAIGHDTGRAPHAAFVLFGTRPHQIKPKGKKALRWAGPGGFVFAKVVNHPGYKGDHYLDAAAETAIRRFGEVISRHWKK